MEVETMVGLKKNSYVYFIPDKNEIYKIKQRNRNKIYVDCYFDQCFAKGLIDNVSGLFSDSPDTKHQHHNNHNHETQYLIAKFQFYEELRKKSKKIGSSSKKIFDDLYVKFRPKLGDIIITYPTVKSSMKNWRKEDNNLPKRPTSVADIFEQLNNIDIDQHFSLGEQKFVHVIESPNEEEASVALYTRDLIDKLISTNDTISAYCDSTFRFFPSMFYQLMIFHFNVGKHAFASIFVFMQKKNFNAYLNVFKHLKSLGIAFQEIVLDYEAATRKAALEVFPDVKLSGCHFHHGQALWRNMKTLCDNTNLSLIRKLQCLVMLPPNLIKETYISIKADYPGSDFKNFFKYYEKYWLKKIKPKNLSIFGSIQRTNNICEAFNSYLKNYEAENINITSNTNFWNVVQLLLQFYGKISIQMSDYIASGFTKNIRVRSRVNAKLQKEAVIRTLYSKLKNGMSGVEFVEMLYPKDYEQLFDQLTMDVALHEDEELSSDEDIDDADEDETSLIRKCEVCLSVKKIIGGFPMCFHIILCAECVLKVNQMCRLPNGKVACIRCRQENDEAKVAFY